MDFYSPLRYPGGKGKMASFFKLLFSKNSLYDSVYVEPYAGGASVGLSLLFNEYASRIVINDIDTSIFAFWHSVLNETEGLCRLIRDTSVNMESREKQEKVYKRTTNHPILDLGFATFFLNRTNRSGIMNAGVIGGTNQNGKWRIDARFNKNDLIERIQRIAQYNNRIELHNVDALVLTRTLRETLPTHSFFYFDPPYYIKGENLYLNYYGHSDHEKVAEEIAQISRQRWVVTYDNVKPIRKMYRRFATKTYGLNYSAGEASKGEEVMIFSKGLRNANHKIFNCKPS